MGKSRSDSTTHSYSSLLLEEDEDDQNLAETLTKLFRADMENGNEYTVQFSPGTDSDSPTEPLLTHRFASLLTESGADD